MGESLGSEYATNPSTATSMAARGSAERIEPGMISRPRPHPVRSRCRENVRFSEGTWAAASWACNFYTHRPSSPASAPCAAAETSSSAT